MSRRISRRKAISTLTAAAFGGAMLSGCASDAGPEPEPTLYTPGTFVAVEGYDIPGEITLLRILDRLQFEKDIVLFLTVYDVRPADWEEAQEAAKRHDIPMRLEIRIEPETAVTDHPYRIVWFRTLTKEEEARVP
jgi:hypothetical protein